MADQDVKTLQNRIKSLESDLETKEQELGLFREEVSKLNQQLELLIDQTGLEVSLAHAIHKFLVPTEMPNIPGFDFSSKYEASAVSGGDYFDIFELEDKYRFGTLLSCSSGFGMSAVLLSILMKLSGQMEAKRGQAPEKVLKAIHAEILETQKTFKNKETHEHTSLFYSITDRRRYECQYCFLGDIEVVHYKYANDELERLEPMGTPLNFGPLTNFESKVITLNPRDRLVICSSGILTAQNSKKEPFGADRLYQTLARHRKSPTHELRNEIFYQIHRFTKDTELSRDLTVLVVDVQDRVIKLAKNS